MSTAKCFEPDPTCLRHTELPHTSRLFADFSYDFERVAAYYAYDPHAPSSLREAAAKVDFPGERRAALVEALAPLNPGSPALAELAKPGTVAVVTGQQVGLFSGPCYTIYKALTAVRLARKLCAQGINAVPIFWLATEDHDFAEVDHAWAFGPSHQPHRLEAEATPLAQQPVGAIPLAHVPMDGLNRLLESFPFGEDVAAQVARAYRPGRTMGEAFRELTQGLLAEYGLLFVDPLTPALRRIAAPLVLEAVRASAEIKAQLAARNAELVDSQYHAQVHIEPKTSLVFVLRDGRRETLRAEVGGYSAKDHRYSMQELLDQPENLSPNALLRPVMQDYLLPTAAYIGGPAEVAYFAQSSVIYKTLRRPVPLVMHRAGFTLVDARAAKLLTRYEAGWPTIFTGEEGIREHIAQRLVPPSLKDTAHRVREAAEASLGAYRKELAGFDPTLAGALDNSRAKILYQLAKIENKSSHEALRRNERARGDAAFLAGLLCPNKHLQERLYTILPFLAKHGPTLIPAIYDALDPYRPDHRLLVI